MDLALLRTFVAFVDHGGVLAAARALRVSKQSLSRRLAALEEAIGAPLVDRDRRPVVPTEGGRVFAERCRAILAATDDALIDVRRRATTVTGTLRLATPQLFARLFLPPTLDRLGRDHPGLVVEAEAIDTPDPSRPWHWDAVVWLGPLPDVHWIAHPLFEARNLICAAPDDPERALLRRPADLARVRTIDYTRKPGPAVWPLARGTERLAVEVTPWLTTNDVDLALQMVLAGRGIGHLPGVLAAPHIAAGRLVDALPGWQAVFGPLTLLYRTPRHRLPRLAVFLDALDRAIAERVPRARRPTPDEAPHDPTEDPMESDP